MPPELQFAAACAVFGFGLLAGSFLNVCIYRLPRNESVVHPDSRCPRCATRLSPADLVPVLSHLLLAGRCRYCGVAVSWRYSAIELLTGLLFLAAFLRFGATVAFPVYTVFLAGLLVETVVDLDCQIIPDEISLGGIAAGLLVAALVSLYPGYTATGLTVGLFDAAAGAFAGFALLWIISFLSRGGMGGGDVKLAGALGAFLGLKGGLLALLLASIAGGVAGLLFIVSGLRSRKDLVPFGPYIALGAAVVVFAGADGVLAWLDGLRDLLGPLLPHPELSAAPAALARLLA